MPVNAERSYLMFAATLLRATPHRELFWRHDSYLEIKKVGKQWFECDTLELVADYENGVPQWNAAQTTIGEIRMDITALQVVQRVLWQKPGRKTKIPVTIKRIAPQETQTVQVTECNSQRFAVARVQDLHLPNANGRKPLDASPVVGQRASADPLGVFDVKTTRIFIPPVMRQRKPRKA